MVDKKPAFEELKATVEEGRKKRRAKIVLIIFMIVSYLVVLYAYGFSLSNIGFIELPGLPELLVLVLAEIGMCCGVIWVMPCYLAACVIMVLKDESKGIKMTSSKYEFLFDVCKKIAIPGTIVFTILWLMGIITPMQNM